VSSAASNLADGGRKAFLVMIERISSMEGAACISDTKSVKPIMDNRSKTAHDFERKATLT